MSGSRCNHCNGTTRISGSGSGSCSGSCSPSMTRLMCMLVIQMIMMVTTTKYRCQAFSIPASSIASSIATRSAPLSPPSSSSLYSSPPEESSGDGTATATATATNGIDMIAVATNALSNFDTIQQQFMKTNGSVGMGGGTSALTFVQTQLSPNDKQSLRNAVMILTNEAHRQRATSANQQFGRIMLGICAENVQEGLMGLRTWVDALALPRGLLHGLDVDGKPMENPETLGSIYLKYNTGGCMTFSQLRKTGKGFDALWRPGDVVLETYDGDFRGIYFSVELADGDFRQFGVLPTDLFLEEDEEDW